MADKSKQSNILVTAHAKSLRIAPRKMRLVTNLIKGLPVEQALVQLQFINKKAAPMLTKLIRSAVANAEHNFSLSPDTLYIKDLTCDMGKVMKRYFPRARGSAFVIRRKLAHVHVTLEARAGKHKKSGTIITEEKSEEVTPKTTASATLPKETKARDGKVPVTKTKQAAVKSSEQVKTNKAQQKRRLFNPEND